MSSPLSVTRDCYWHDRRWQLVSLAVIILVIIGCGWRAVKLHHPPGPYNAARMGFGDFHNGSYFPALAFLDGVSPYGAKYTESYPVPRPTPLFSPLLFLLHAPLALLPLSVAEWVYFTMLPVLLCLLAGVLLSNAKVPLQGWLLPVLAVMIVSRPVGITLVTGYFTLEIIVGVVLALAYARHQPWLAAVGIALASQKPNFVIPLLLLMLASGHWRAVWRGVALSAAGALAAIAWLLQNTTITEMIVDMQTAQQIHRDDAAELPVAVWTRLDLTGLVAKWTHTNPDEQLQFAVMLLLLLLPAWVLWRSRHESCGESVVGPRNGLIMLALLVSIYHHSYDAMLLFAPIVGVVIGPSTLWRKIDSPAKWFILVMMLVPLYNITSTRMFLSRTVGFESDWFQVLSSVNSVALVLALAVLVISLMRADRANSDPIA